MLSFLEDDAAYLIGVVENQGFPVFPDAPEDGKIPSAGEDVEEPPQGIQITTYEQPDKINANA